MKKKKGYYCHSKENILIKFIIINGKKDCQYQVKFKDLSNNTLQESKIVICEFPDTPLKLLEKIFSYEFGKNQKLDIDLIIKSPAEEKTYKKGLIIEELIGNNKKNENNTKTFLLGGIDDEKLEISYEIIKNQTKFLRIHFKNNISSNNEIYFQDEKYKMFFQIEKLGQLIYESEAFTDDGKFSIVQIPTNILEPNFNIIFYSFKKDELSQYTILENTKISTSFTELAKNIGEPICFNIISLDDILTIFNYSSIGEEITFLDYIKKGGIQLRLNIGIDFTKSNKPPEYPGSLHSYTNEEKNPYEKVISACGKIFEYYNYDQLFPVYGFGAVVNGETSHCFNINFENNPEIELVDNIIKEYHKCIQYICFSGPTYFAPLINKVVTHIKEQKDSKKYQVLMILTDGIIQDMKDTIDALVEGSYYPLSVIIIGIGNSDFEAMKTLDNDAIPLISSKGIKRQRDILQFLPFNKYNGDVNKLVYEVLKEIPRQVVEFYTLNYQYPDKLK